MNDDFEKLLADCQQQMEDSGYSYVYMNKIIQEWNELKEWLTIHDATEFNEDVAFKYCDETIGNHIIYDGISNSDKLKLRAVRMLTSFNKYGSFEFRSPRVEKSSQAKWEMKLLNLSATASRKDIWQLRRLRITVAFYLVSVNSLISGTLTLMI